jgi:hypothetical protein
MGFGHIREKLRKRKEINEKRKGVVIFEQWIFGEMVTRPHDFLRKETAHQGIRSQSQHVSIYYSITGRMQYAREGNREDASCRKIAEAGMFLSFVKGLEKPGFLAHHGIQSQKPEKYIFYILLHSL